MFAAETSFIVTEPMNFTNQYDDVFDGYDGMETTLTGRVGYNYAISLPNGETLRFGFDPDNTVSESVVMDIYGLGSGWQLKLPRIGLQSTGAPEMYRPNGYSYACINSKALKDARSIGDSTYLISKKEDNMLAYNGAFGEYEIFDINGRICNSTDSLGNTTTYVYDDNLLSEINYSDGSSVLFVRKESEVEIVYEMAGSSTSLASFVLAENNGSLVLEKIDTDSDVSFQYSLGLNGELVLTYFDNSRYERYITYSNSEGDLRITGYESVYDDGDNSSVEYSYGLYGYISEVVYENGIESFTYDKLANNCIKINTVKNYNSVITTSSRTIDGLGQMVEYSYPDATLSLTFENGRLMSQKENDELYTYSYNDKGLLTKACLPTGEIVDYTYAENGDLVSKMSSTRGEISTQDSNLISNTITPRDSISDSISIQYNINDQVGVTNFVEACGLDQFGFNCYTFAIAKYTDLCNPGTYSNIAITDKATQYTASTIKAYTESDQRNLGRQIYDSTVDAAIPGHSWKIVLKMRVGDDYHFMKRSNGSSGSAYWQFKAGAPGPVMRLRDDYTPSTVSWDMYSYNIWLGYTVYETNYYNDSGIYYMIIED